mmetsp:Transcript_6366/g.17815  ORF Transcript_6366/g.17815 Transcript_6366/m.17815 type:complete len:314 (-) Transcript_6366:2163-3104(-)
MVDLPKGNRPHVELHALKGDKVREEGQPVAAVGEHSPLAAIPSVRGGQPRMADRPAASWGKKCDCRALRGEHELEGKLGGFLELEGGLQVRCGLRDVNDDDVLLTQHSLLHLRAPEGPRVHGAGILLCRDHHRPGLAPPTTVRHCDIKHVAEVVRQEMDPGHRLVEELPLGAPHRVVGGLQEAVDLHCVKPHRDVHPVCIILKAVPLAQVAGVLAEGGPQDPRAKERVRPLVGGGDPKGVPVCVCAAVVQGALDAEKGPVDVHLMDVYALCVQGLSDADHKPVAAAAGAVGAVGGGLQIHPKAGGRLAEDLQH